MNLLEYGLGGDPKVADPSALPVLDSSNSRLNFVFRRDASLTGLNFTVQASEAPTDEDIWTDVAESVGGAVMKSLATGFTVTEAGAGSVKIVTVGEDASGGAAAPHFMRLRISRTE